MAKSTRSGGRNARPAAKGGGAGGAGGGGGRAQRPASKDGAVDQGTKGPARPSAKDAAAKAVARGPGKGRSSGSGFASAGGPGAKAAKPAAEKASPAVKRPPAPNKRTTPPASARYTPPIPKSEKVSPIWVPILMFACLGLGMLIIILNYVNVLPGKDPSNAYLMVGLALITIGFVTATKYH